MDPKYALGLGGLGCLAVCGCLAAVAIPNFVAMQYRAKRAELPSYCDGIKTAELGYEAAFDVFVPTAVAPRPLHALDGDAVPWTYPPDFETMGWSSDSDLRGAYWVETNGATYPAGDFTVHCVSDIDEDGVLAHYTATKSVNAVLLSSNDTY